MLVIHQGDQLMIPFEIEQNGEPLLPEKTKEIRICVDDIVRYYSKGELTYYNNVYLFPLSSQESKNLVGIIKVQVEVQFGTSEVHSQVFNIKVAKTLNPLL